MNLTHPSSILTHLIHQTRGVSFFNDYTWCKEFPKILSWNFKVLLRKECGLWAVLLSVSGAFILLHKCLEPQMLLGKAGVILSHTLNRQNNKKICMVLQRSNCKRVVWVSHNMGKKIKHCFKIVPFLVSLIYKFSWFINITV